MPVTPVSSLKAPQTASKSSTKNPYKKLEKVKNIGSGISSILTPPTPKSIVKKTLKPSTVEHIQTPKTSSKVIDKFQKDRGL